MNDRYTNAVQYNKMYKQATYKLMYFEVEKIYAFLFQVFLS